MSRSTKTLCISLVLTLAGSSCLFSDERGADSSPVDNTDPGIVTNDPGVVRTVSIATFDQVLSSMASLTGTTPSTATIAFMDLNRSSFALQGRTTEITSGMWMAISALAGHVCRDLYDQERVKGTSDRIYYRALNLAAGGSNTRANLDLARDRLVVGIWGRTAFTDEDGFFDTALTDSGVTEPYDTNETRNALLILCTGTLASLSAVSR